MLQETKTKMTPTEILLHKITDRTMIRIAIAESYALAPKDQVNWSVVDQAIINRWSQCGLNWIRNEVKYRFSSKQAREELSKNRVPPLWKCSCTWWNGSNHKVCQKCDEEKSEDEQCMDLN